MAVPNTNTFSLQDVVDEISGTQGSLQDCVDDATESGFDTNYYTSPATSLLEFRNYVDFICSDYSNGLPFTMSSGHTLVEAAWMNGGRAAIVVQRVPGSGVPDSDVIRIFKTNTPYCVNGLTNSSGWTISHHSTTTDMYYAFNHEASTFVAIDKRSTGGSVIRALTFNTSNDSISLSTLTNVSSIISFIDSAGSDFLGVTAYIGSDGEVTGFGVLEKQYTSVSGVYKHRLRLYSTNNNDDWTDTSATWFFEADVIMNSNRGSGNTTPVTRVYSLGCAINGAETEQTVWFATDETGTGIWKYGWNISWDHLLETNVSSEEDDPLDFGIDLDEITLGSDQILAGDYHDGTGASDQRATVIDYSTLTAIEMETDNTTSGLFG